SLNFLGRERRRYLLDNPYKSHCNSSYFFKCHLNWLRRRCGLAFGVVGIGGEAEADLSLVGLLRCHVKLGKAGHTADNQREDAGGHGVERAQMADGAFVENAA